MSAITPFSALFDTYTIRDSTGGYQDSREEQNKESSVEDHENVEENASNNWKRGGG